MELNSYKEVMPTREEFVAKLQEAVDKYGSSFVADKTAFSVRTIERWIASGTPHSLVMCYVIDLIDSNFKSHSIDSEVHSKNIELQGYVDVWEEFARW